MDEYGIDIDHVIRHYDVTGKICPAPYVNNDNYKTSWTWNQFKTNLASYRGSGAYTPSQNTDSGSSQSANSTYPATPFSVKIIIDDLNMRQGPSTSYSSNGYWQRNFYYCRNVW